MEAALALSNYVQLDFSVATGTEYRCWAFVGGCCAETMTFSYQATELLVPNPKNAKEMLPAELGAAAAAIAKLPILNLKKLHSQHNGPKQATTWEWVAIPLPKYATPGAKSLRLLTDQKGFSLGCVLVSSLRQLPPKDPEFREIERLRAESTGSATKRGAYARGSILREYWNNVSGGSVADLTRHPAFPDNPSGSEQLSLLDGPVNTGENYGSRIRGYVHPPVSVEYVFMINSDDASELWLSSDDNPANRARIAGVQTWAPRGEWTKEPNQTSVPVPLRADRRYYIEVLHKQGGSGAHVTVGWRLPSGVEEKPIPGSRLSPLPVATK